MKDPSVKDPSVKDPSVAVAGLRDDLGAPNDALFAFTNTLRLSVRAKVAAEQQRGLSLSEIVIQIREMVRVANEDALHPQPFASRAFRMMSRQALAWCVEAYQPLVFMAGNGFSHGPNKSEPLALRPAPVQPGPTVARTPALSPNNRGTP